jgi:hypothetical protein
MEQMEPTNQWGNCTIRVVAYDTPDGEPFVGSNGLPNGDPTTVDIDKLLTGLGALADRAGQTLNDLKAPPSSFTLTGSVALEAKAGVVFTIGVTAGISVSMTWNFAEESTSTHPTRPSKRPLDPKP